MTLIKVVCLRCNHNWIPRVEEVKWCPKCKSPYWNKQKIKNSGPHKKSIDKQKVIKYIIIYGGQLRGRALRLGNISGLTYRLDELPIKERLDNL